MADLVTTISETVTLNGSLRGSSNSVTTTDIIGMLRHSSRQSLAGTDDINAPIYFTQDQFSIEPFQERFDNLLCGWTFTIGIKTMNDFDTCTIPVTDAGAGY